MGSVYLKELLGLTELIHMTYLESAWAFVWASNISYPYLELKSWQLCHFLVCSVFDLLVLISIYYFFPQESF